MELMNRIRKSRKGFTLVEIIVVLVILAILAAFTIPSMMGFVNDAKKKAAIAEQREIYVAAQAIVTEQYAKLGETAAEASGVLNLGSAVIAAATTPEAKEALKDVTKTMSGYLGTDIKAGTGSTDSVWTVYVEDGQVKRVAYTRDGIKLDDLVPSSAIK